MEHHQSMSPHLIFIPLSAGSGRYIASFHAAVSLQPNPYIRRTRSHLSSQTGPRWVWTFPLPGLLPTCNFIMTLSSFLSPRLITGKQKKKIVSIDILCNQASHITSLWTTTSPWCTKLILITVFLRVSSVLLSPNWASVGSWVLALCVTQQTAMCDCTLILDEAEEFPRARRKHNKAVGAWEVVTIRMTCDVHNITQDAFWSYTSSRQKIFCSPQKKTTFLIWKYSTQFSSQCVGSAFFVKRYPPAGQDFLGVSNPQMSPITFFW